MHQRPRGRGRAPARARRTARPHGRPGPSRPLSRRRAGPRRHRRGAAAARRRTAAHRAGREAAAGHYWARDAQRAPRVRPPPADGDAVARRGARRTACARGREEPARGASPQLPIRLARMGVPHRRRERRDRRRARGRSIHQAADQGALARSRAAFGHRHSRAAPQRFAARRPASRWPAAGATGRSRAAARQGPRGGGRVRRQRSRDRDGSSTR
mmetsp:Transcript_31379/g.95506  ORF Transcript_31379/g.95506 Transcript_31379/m.95506 type:complete len:214 (+) Transcript_31379:332-973(+)